MKTHTKRNSLLLLLTAFIWGLAFVAQSEGGALVGPYTFNTIRSFIGFLTLTPVIYILESKDENRKVKTKEEKSLLWKGGLLCGLCLGLATNLQQVGIYYGSSTGKAGFLTTCYIILVPILGIFLKRKCPAIVWVSVLIALVGLYFLCLSETFHLAGADILILLCALIFAIQILLVDYYAPLVSGVRLARIEFLIAALASLVLMLIFEFGYTPEAFHNWLMQFASLQVWIPILYAGVLSCGVAYTLQIIGQRDVNPTVASLIMSFESVFSVIGAWIIQNQHMSGRQLIGCGLLFLAVVLCQVVHK